MKKALPIFLPCIPNLGFVRYIEEDSAEPCIYAIRKASTSINLDGNNEAYEWEGYKTVSSFENHWPNILIGQKIKPRQKLLINNSSINHNHLKSKS
jgi:hypothetical protein